MRKIIGIGETILDIIFRNNQPSVAVPGGSIFNGMISLRRTGLDVSFISETGNDRVGKTILEFMEENHLNTELVNVSPESKTPVSLTFLDRENDVEYLYYKDYPNQRLDGVFPPVHEDDIVMFGSYFALNPVLRGKIVELLEQAKEKKAIIYYDPNFRSTHKDEAMKLTPVIIENLEYATIVRGSKNDFENMYKLEDVDRIYKEKIQFYCPNFLYTNGTEHISLRTKTIAKEYPVKPVETVSTIGAGDNFNAGLIYGLLKYDVRQSEIDNLSEAQWDRIVKYGTDFAAEVCRTFSNSISQEFAESLLKDAADG
ncbi:MAG: carbohydrate kinase [Mediterranea sp.]|jgi:fructokinase|nr:carbohydrate kinase [Mediterranea sp.]